MTHLIRPWLVAMWTAAGLVACASTTTLAAEVPFDSLLAYRDVVVIGRLVARDTVFRHSQGPCADPRAGRMRFQDTYIAVERVLRGTVDDSIIVLTSPSSVPSRPQSSGRATRVLAWAMRECSDNWRLWGWYCGVSDEGTLFADDEGAAGGFYRLSTGRAKEMPQLEAIESQLHRLRASGRDSMVAAAAAIALCRIRERTPAPGGYELGIEVIKVLMGASDRVPDRLAVSAVRACFQAGDPGDTLLVPVPRAFGGGILAVDGCLRPFEVKNGFVPGMGVPVEFLRHAVRETETGFRVSERLLRD